MLYSLGDGRGSNRLAWRIANSFMGTFPQQAETATGTAPDFYRVT
jgi:hypothetical protein